MQSERWCVKCTHFTLRQLQTAFLPSTNQETASEISQSHRLLPTLYVRLSQPRNYSNHNPTSYLQKLLQRARESLEIQDINKSEVIPTFRAHLNFHD